MASKVPERCLVFVDDSNIWIEAQKYAALGNTKQNIPKLDGEQDPRVRINAGKLARTICQGRDRGPSFYYGSRPPPNDSVWNAFEKVNFHTNIFDKSGGGREKEVDTKMVADMTKIASDLDIRAEYSEGARRLKAATTFVCITGDLDMRPGILVALEAGIRVELWAWEASMSRKYLELKGQNELFTVHYLHWIYENVYFTNYSSTLQVRDGSGKLTSRVDPERTVVLQTFKLRECMGPSASPGLVPHAVPETAEGRRRMRKDLDQAIAEQLIYLGKLFYLTWSTLDDQEPDEWPGALFVDFRNVPVDHFEETLLRVRRELADKASVVSYPEYFGKLRVPSVRMMETSNMYGPLGDDDGDSDGSGSSSSSSHSPPAWGWSVKAGTQGPACQEDAGADAGTETSANPWQTVKRSDPKRDHHRGIRRAQQCRDGIRCFKRGECGYAHSNEELNMFRDQPDINFKKWKTTPCQFNPCRLGKHCSYAHSPREAWCAVCRHEGHFVTECQHKGVPTGRQG